MGQWPTVGINLPRGIFWMGTSSVVKSKGLLGWWIYMWTSLPSHLYSAWSVMAWAIVHQLSWIVIGSATRQACFPSHMYQLQWVGMQLPWPHLWLDLPPMKVFHKKGLPYLVLSLLLWWGQSWHHAAYLLLGMLSRNERVWYIAPNSFINVTCISRQYLVLGQPEGSLKARNQDEQVGRRTTQGFWLLLVLCTLGWHVHMAFHLEVSSRCSISWVTRFGSHWHEISGCELKLWIQSF